CALPIWPDLSRRSVEPPCDYPRGAARGRGRTTARAEPPASAPRRSPPAEGVPGPEASVALPPSAPDPSCLTRRKSNIITFQLSTAFAARSFSLSASGERRRNCDLPVLEPCRSDPGRNWKDRKSTRLNSSHV